MPKRIPTQSNNKKSSHHENPPHGQTQCHKPLKKECVSVVVFFYFIFCKQSSWNEKNGAILLFASYILELDGANEMKTKRTKKKTHQDKTYFGLKFNQNITSAFYVAKKSTLGSPQPDLFYFLFVVFIECAKPKKSSEWIEAHTKIDTFYFYYCHLCYVLSFDIVLGHLHFYFLFYGYQIFFHCVFGVCVFCCFILLLSGCDFSTITTIPQDFPHKTNISSTLYRRLWSLSHCTFQKKA